MRGENTCGGQRGHANGSGCFPWPARQFSPRVLQLTLGVFVATFVYAMVILRSVRGGDEGEAFDREPLGNRHLNHGVASGSRRYMVVEPSSGKPCHFL